MTNCRTVLVVEDEPMIRMMGAEVLADSGFEVVEAESADEAISILRSGKSVDVLFTDIRMPGMMNGLELAESVHVRWPIIRIVITSGHVRLRDDQIPDDGVFLPKPYALNNIVVKVREVLDS
jgi:CheY-like chemotaxis protein